VFNSITIQGDWKASNESFDDPYETMTFTVAGGTLLKQEPADGGPIVFADRIVAGGCGVGPGACESAAGVARNQSSKHSDVRHGRLCQDRHRSPAHAPKFLSWRECHGADPANPCS
jgi:hypothetical protein